MIKELTELKLVLRAVALSETYRDEVPLRLLESRYKYIVGADIPVCKWGYRMVLPFLQDCCSDTFVIHGSNPNLTVIVPSFMKLFGQVRVGAAEEKRVALVESVHATSRALKEARAQLHTAQLEADEAVAAWRARRARHRMAILAADEERVAICLAWLSKAYREADEAHKRLYMAQDEADKAHAVSWNARLALARHDTDEAMDACWLARQKLQKAIKSWVRLNLALNYHTHGGAGRAADMGVCPSLTGTALADITRAEASVHQLNAEVARCKREQEAVQIERLFC